MNYINASRVLRCLAAILLGLASNILFAQNYPTKPVRIIVPFSGRDAARADWPPPEAA